MAKTYNIKNAGINSIVVQGRVGKDPVWREVGDGMLSFSIAYSESYKDKGGEWVETTTWFDVACFGKQAQIFHGKFGKGDIVCVNGKMVSNKKDERVFWSIKPDFGGIQVVAKGEGESAPTPAAKVDDDDLPF